jgi:hypothetical protein
MVNSFFIFISLCLLAIVFRKLNNTNAELKFRSAVLRLRSQLRLYAIEGSVPADSKAFAYLDFTLCQLVKESYTITLFFLVTLPKKHVDKIERYKSAYLEIEKEISKHALLKEIEQQKNEAIKHYLSDQNKLLFSFLALIAIPFSFAGSLRSYIQKIRADYKTKISRTAYYPETSGLSY